MFARVPYTNVFVNEFGTCKYTDFQGNYREDRGYLNKSGYRLIKISSRKFYYIHRLVARVFVHNEAPNYFNVVHHMDKDRQNNSASNLQWTTKQLNNADKRNTRVVKKERDLFRVQFVFAKKLYKGKLYDDLKIATDAGLKYKKRLITDAREMYIKCERTGENPHPLSYCPKCGHGFIDTKV